MCYIGVQSVVAEHLCVVAVVVQLDPHKRRHSLRRTGYQSSFRTDRRRDSAEEKRHAHFGAVQVVEETSESKLSRIQADLDEAIEGQRLQVHRGGVMNASTAPARAQEHPKGKAVEDIKQGVLSLTANLLA